MARRLLLYALLLAAACRSAEAPVPRERVVVALPKAPGSEPKRPPEWFDQQIAAAEEALREGRLEEGFERVLAARAQSPGPEDAADLDRLVRRLNQAVLDLPTLRAAVEPESDPIEFGEPVRVRVRLENSGARPVRVRARPPRASPTLLVLDVVRTEYDVRARVVSARRQVHHPLRRDLDLPPGGTTEIAFTIPGAGNDRPLDGFRTFTVGGQLRAGALELGGLRRHEPVRLRPGMLRSFRPNYGHLCDDPLQRIRMALERNAPVHLLTAAGLLPAAQRREAVDTLVGALRGGGPMDYAVYACLEYVTRGGLGPDADAWRAWWPRVRERYFDEAEGVWPGEGPRFATDEPTSARSRTSARPPTPRP